MDAWCDDTAEEGDNPSDTVEGRRGPEVDDDRISSEEGRDRDRIGDSVGSDAEWLFDVESDWEDGPGLARSSGHTKVPPTHLYQSRAQGWGERDAQRRPYHC